MNRRIFLQRSALMAASAMCLDLPTWASTVKNLGEPRLKVGILSDIHIRGEETMPPIIKALEYFKSKEADAVMIVGDMADHGMHYQLKRLADAWYSIFPNDRGINGQHVEKLFVYGNHDVDDIEHVSEKYKIEMSLALKEGIHLRRDKVWEELFHEKWQPIYMKDVKGYKFIGAHFHNWHFIPNLEEFMEKMEGNLPKDKPFFYFQHMHPKDTCSAPWTWGQDDGKTTEILSKYPNAVAFSGHSHTSLTDERTIWQGAFTSVGTASMSYIIPFGGRENSKVFGSKETVPSQMDVISCKDGKQGQFMTIYDDCITLERREFVYDQPLGNNWIIPLPLTKERPLSFEQRAKESIAPEFAADAKVGVSQGKGKDRNKKEQMQISVKFPTALSSQSGVRAFDYEVQAEVEDRDTYKICCTKRVFSNAYYLGEAQDKKNVECVFGTSELPQKKNIRFIVRPVECFGKKGKPIYSDWTKIK